MTGGLERTWVRMLDSSAWRTLAKHSTVRALGRSGVLAATDLKRRSVLSRLHARRARDRYGDIRILCVLVGHMKSGGSLLRGLLDAHPNVAFADEIDALAYFSAGLRPEQVFYLLEKGARRDAMKGSVTARRLEPYSFAVPGQWQGRSTTLRVVGDSKAGIATQRLGAKPDLLHDLRERLGDVELRFLHVVRNPFDPLSVMMIRGHRTLDGAMKRYFDNCAILDGLHARLPSSMIKVVRYEDMVADTVASLASVCGFLGLEADDDYLDACASVIHERPPERTRIEWEDDDIDRIQNELSKHAFLEGYAFELQGDRS